MTTLEERSPEGSPSSSGPPRPQIIPAAVLLGASCSIAAGALHLGASQTHLEHVTLSRLFLAQGTAQIVVGAALLMSTSRNLRYVAVAVNAVSALAWFVTRLVGVSWVPGLEVREAPQTADTIGAVLAGAAVVALVLSLVRARAGASTADGTAGASRLHITTTVVVATALAIFGIARLNSHEHDHDEEAAAESSDAAWRLGASDTEVADTEQFIEETQAAVATFTSIADAESKGFVRINDQHLLHRDRVFDDKQLDPSAIESLVVSERDGEDYISGGMYLMDINETMKDVPRMGGPLMVWHSHGGFCFEPSGVIKGGPEAGGTCPSGSVWLDDPPMLHIHSEVQADDGKQRTPENCGTFTFTDLPFDEPVPGCGESEDHSMHAHS